jgi:hypothetical protein
MANGYKYITLFSIIFFLLHTQLVAQQISTVVMNVSVEVVSGSTVEMNNPEWFTFQEESSEAAPYAMITIRQQEDGLILTSSSDSITLINGVDQFEMKTEMTQYRNESGDIELHYSGSKSDHIKSGKYSGKQITEIIYL